uniref:Uncharacterized protein MANES_05G134700 n=1 Tax=Rhizophora mucronata TaxID=61149 RepID=A0A2P2M9A6_RHIMU
MEIKRISTECVKPSSPTPCHLKKYKLSLLDQFMMPVYTFRILFYPMTPDASAAGTEEIISERSRLLKQSLSETLTLYYPLAGKMDDSLSIDCNDEGAYYVKARANCSLSEFLSQPDLTLLGRFLPSEPSWRESSEGIHVAMVQETIFACGGIVVGAYVTHKFVDGTALVAFLKCWAAIARKSLEEIVPPKLDAPSFFIQNDAYPKDADLMAFNSPFIRKGRPATGRFVFDASAIARLKARAIQEKPTRVEAVSALLSKCVMSAFKARLGIDRPTIIGHNVNMRRRAVPPFPEQTIGNFPWATLFIAEEKDMSVLVHQLREAISRIDGDFVKNLQGDEGWLKLSAIIKEKSRELASPVFSNGWNHLEFSSWCNFGLYDIDFGWGKPVWATYSGPDASETLVYNIIVLVDTRIGRGIEAWVLLDEEEIDILVRDEELLAYATPNPSPLKIGLPN